MTSLTEAYGTDIENTNSPISSSFDNIKSDLMRIIEEPSEDEEENIEEIDIDLDSFNNDILKLKEIILNKHKEYIKLNADAREMEEIHCQLAKFSVTLDDFNSKHKNKLELDLSSNNFDEEMLEVRKSLRTKTNTIKKLLSVAHNLSGIGMQRSCPICLSKEVNYAIIPCGHTFCEDCISKSRNHTCCICRTTYSAQPLKLFYC